MDLLQIATGITKCDDYYKLRQYRVQIPSGAQIFCVLLRLILYISLYLLYNHNSELFIVNLFMKKNTAAIQAVQMKQVLNNTQ